MIKNFSRITGAIPQLIGPAGTLRRQARFSDIGVRAPQGCMCDRESGIDLSGVFEKEPLVRQTWPELRTFNAAL